MRIVSVRDSWRIVSVRDSLLQLLCVLAPSALTTGKLGLEGASSGDGRLHGHQLTDELLHTHTHTQWRKFTLCSMALGGAVL